MQNTLQELNSICPNTLMESLGIEFIEVGEGYLKAKMPIDQRTCRPDGSLHGGANMALAETVGGALSMITVPKELRFSVYGIEINGNHMKQAKGCYVIACGKFIHCGKRTHVIEVEIKDEMGAVVTVNRVTNMVV